MTMRTQEGLRVVPPGIHRSSSKGDAVGSTAPMTRGSGDTTLPWRVDEARPDAEPGQATERTVFKTRRKRKEN